MKIIISIVILYMIGVELIAQDLLVTPKGDSLNCKITKEKSDLVHFTFKYENEIRYAIIPKKQIKYMKKNFFNFSEVPTEKFKFKDTSYQKIRIGVNGGLSYMTGKINKNLSNDIQNYYKDLKTGYNIGFDFTYFNSENIGFGLIYSLFRTSNQLSNISILDSVTGKFRTGELKDDITLHYIGPSLCTRINSFNKKTSFISNISLGYLSYQNSVTVIDNFKLNGNSLGLLWDIGMDYSIKKNLLLGIIFSYKFGTLSHVKYKDGIQIRTLNFDQNEFLNISRIDLSIGLKWTR